MFVSDVDEFDDKFLSFHGFRFIGVLLVSILFWLVNVVVVIPSSNDCKSSHIWRLTNPMSLILLFVYLLFLGRYIDSRMIHILFAMFLVSNSISEDLTFNP